MAEELLMTFSDELKEVALIPGSNGVFIIRLDGETLFSKAESGHFPEMKTIKQQVRDLIAPAKDLGHSDKK